MFSGAYRLVHPFQGGKQNTAGTSEVEAHKSFRAEVPAVREAHSCFLEEGCRIICRQIPAVDPGQIGRLDVVHAHTRCARDEIFHQIAVAPEIIEQGEMPVFRIAVRGQSGGETQHVYMGYDAFHSLPERGAESFVRDDRQRTTQAGEIIGFAGGEQGDGTCGNFVI